MAMSMAIASLSSSSSSPHYKVGFGFSCMSSSTNDRSLRANFISKESNVLEISRTSQDELHNAKSWTTSNNDLMIYPTNRSQEPNSTPLVSALENAIEENHASFQFPGHNLGHAAPSLLTRLIGELPFHYDLGEIEGQFTPESPILEAEKQAAKVFGASKTWFLLGGSTCGVLAAIMSTCNPGDTLILPRNCHISAISAMCLCGAIPKYVFPDYDSYWDAATSASLSEVERAIKESEIEGRKPAAIFITSPTYNGICSNVKEIATLCHSNDIPLIVDEAHGAHFGFHPQLPVSALQQGADVVVQSTHKESNVVEISRTSQDELHNAKSWTTSNNDLMTYPTNRSQEPNSTPLVSALENAIEENHASFQFPGHNLGHAAPSSLTRLIGELPFHYDLGEIEGQFTSESLILEAEKQAAKVFGASKTWFLLGGSTCGVLAAIMGTCNPGDTLILPRNCHISAISAMCLCGAIPKYVFPDYDSYWDAATSVPLSEVEREIKESEIEGRKPAAIFITSPTYNGICSNVKEIATLCHSHNIPLIVDEAHGAHFGFHPQLPISALQQGADVVVQSTHKVLMSLTQSSMLHASQSLLVDKDKINRCLQILQSTSPSFLLLSSLDATTFDLKQNPILVFDNAIKLAKEAKIALTKIPGISVLDFPDTDPLRVTVGVHDLNVSGYEAKDFLFKDQRVVPVLTGSCAIAFLFIPGSCREHVARLVAGFENLSSSCILQGTKKQGVVHITIRPFVDIEMKLTPREALFAKKKRVDIKDTLGKICGELICPFPPGVPIMIPGEIITEKALDILLQAKACGARITGASDPNLSLILVCEV